MHCFCAILQLKKQFLLVQVNELLSFTTLLRLAGGYLVGVDNPDYLPISGH